MTCSHRVSRLSQSVTYGSRVRDTRSDATGPRRSPRAPTRVGPRARRASRRVACALRTAPRARRSSAAAVGRAPVGGDEQRYVVVTVLELDLDADSSEERRGRPEQQAIDAGFE